MPRRLEQTSEMVRIIPFKVKIYPNRDVRWKDNILTRILKMKIGETSPIHTKLDEKDFKKFLEIIEEINEGNFAKFHKFKMVIRIIEGKEYATKLPR